VRAVLDVQLGDPLGADELDRDVAAVDAARSEREREQPLDLLERQDRPAEPEDLDLQ
jgi:hypothetical protein